MTSPPPHFSDSYPVVSPDGLYLGFVRRNAACWGGNVFVQKMDGLRPVGEAAQLTFDNTSLSLDWTRDSRRIIYDSGYGRGGLWRVAATGGKPEPLLTNVRAARPSVSWDGVRALFQNTTIDANIWRMPGPGAPREGTPAGAAIRIIASTFGDTSP